MWCFFLFKLMMRLAISVLVKPSLALRCAVYLLSFIGFASVSYSVYVHKAYLGNFQAVIVLVIALAMLLFFKRWAGKIHSYRIEMDAKGVILLRVVDQDLIVIKTTQAYINRFVILSAYLIVLNVRCESGKDRNLLILFDSVAKDDFRRLKVAVNYWATRCVDELDRVKDLSEGNF